ncbi:SP-RING-type domain-containing protein [Entamoeba marina]
MQTFLDYIPRKSLPALSEFGITSNNYKSFFSVNGAINKKKVVEIRSIVKILEVTIPSLHLSKKSGMKKKEYITYICNQLNTPISGKVSHNNSPYPSSTTLSIPRYIDPFSNSNYYSQPFQLTTNYPPYDYHMYQQQNYYPNPFNYPFHPTLGSNFEYYKKQPRHESDHSRTILPQRFYQTQHPQFPIEEILYSSALIGLNKTRFTLNTSGIRTDQKIIIRAFNKVQGSDYSDIYIEQICVNSTYVDIDSFFSPIVGMARSKPTIIKPHIDITTQCYSSINNISVTLNKYSEDIIIVIALCSYQNQQKLIADVFNGDNQYFVETMMNKTKEHKTQSNASEQNKLENIDEDIVINKDKISLICPLGIYANFYPYITVDTKFLKIIKEAPKGCSGVEITGDHFEFIGCENETDESEVVEV